MQFCVIKSLFSMIETSSRNLLFLLFLQALLLSEAQADTIAVLAVGSKGLENYRHQADVCHAYHALLAHGIQPERLYVLSVDDAVSSPLNPWPGQLFNTPSSFDYHSGCIIDFRAEDATKMNFELLIEVLSNDPIAPPFVIESLPFLFIYFVDHGGNDILAFPDGWLTGEQLRSIALRARRKFRVIMFIEACRAGSLFSTTLPRGVLAVTAANASGPSFGIFCNHGICLADDFSAAWINALDSSVNQTLGVLISEIERNTLKSWVSVFGDSAMLSLSVDQIFS